MYAQAETSKKSESRAIANSFAPKRCGERQELGFRDNRSEMIAQQQVMQRVNESNAPIQRVIKVGDTRISKYTYKGQLLRENGIFKTEWDKTPSPIQDKIMILINDSETHGPFASWNNLVVQLGGEKVQDEIKTEKPWNKIQLGFGFLNVRVLNEKGGYHLILEIKELPDYVMRARKKDATPIKLGITNWNSLSNRFKQVDGLVRVPKILNIETAQTDNAYIVERVTKEVDALELWNILTNSPNEELRKTVVKPLKTIADMFQRNINDMLTGKNESFPDFRPSNVGFKGNDPTLVYIDFDQPQSKQNTETLKAHAMEWAGRRFIKDEGGAREPNEKLWNFLTGGLLGSMKDAIHNY